VSRVIAANDAVPTICERLLELDGVFFTFLARNHTIVDERSKAMDVVDAFRANLPEEVWNAMLLLPLGAAHDVAGHLTATIMVFDRIAILFLYDGHDTYGLVTLKEHATPALTETAAARIREGR
jgi:hypothetical protein